MLGEHAPVVVDHLAGLDSGRVRARSHEPRVVAVGHEANFLTLGLVRVGEPERAGVVADLALGHRAERKERAGRARAASAKRK